MSLWRAMRAAAEALYDAPSPGGDPTIEDLTRR
jgi:hypothetical protein